MMRRAAKILDASWFSLTHGKLATPVLQAVINDIKECFTTYQEYPEVRVWTDSQKTRTKNYQYSPVVVLHLWNKCNRIFYTKYLQRGYKDSVESFENFNTRRLSREWHITIAIADELFHALINQDIAQIEMKMHFDYNLDEEFASNKAYHAIQALISTIDFPHSLSYKPNACGATKAADMVIRKM